MDKALIFMAMAGYMSIIIGIGFYYYKRSNENSDNFFLGGRSLGPWVAAISAGASDMSGWLLMGLPGVAYWSGLSDAFWTAIGLAAGTALNWIIVSKRLRHYSESARAITLPEFFSNRFHEDRRVILTVSSTFIFVFFSVYAASCFVTVGKLFATLFEVPYIPMMIGGSGVRRVLHVHRRIFGGERLRLYAGHHHDRGFGCGLWSEACCMPVGPERSLITCRASLGSWISSASRHRPWSKVCNRLMARWLPLDLPADTD